jgi:hypothetical protein
LRGYAPTQSTLLGAAGFCRRTWTAETWPEDDWHSLGLAWDLNVYHDQFGQPAATLYPMVWERFGPDPVTFLCWTDTRHGYTLSADVVCPGDRLSRCASEIRRIRRQIDEQLDDIDLFDAPSECKSLVVRGEAHAIACSLEHHGFTGILPGARYTQALEARITDKQAYDEQLIV